MVRLIHLLHLLIFFFKKDTFGLGILKMLKLLMNKMIYALEKKFKPKVMNIIENEYTLF